MGVPSLLLSKHKLYFHTCISTGWYACGQVLEIVRLLNNHDLCNGEKVGSYLSLVTLQGRLLHGMIIQKSERTHGNSLAYLVLSRVLKYR